MSTLKLAPPRTPRPVQPESPCPRAMKAVPSLATTTIPPAAAGRESASTATKATAATVKLLQNDNMDVSSELDGLHYVDTQSLQARRPSAWTGIRWRLVGV